jgi:hypothetical protein
VFADTLGKVESGNDYTAYNRTKPELTAYYKTNLTTMTIAEVQQAQADGTMFATGRFQIVTDTLADAVKRLGLDTSLKYDEAMQDKIFEEYLIKLKRKQIIEFLEGDGDVEAAIYAWAKEFASAGVRKGKAISSIAERDETGKKKKDANDKTIMIARVAEAEGVSYYQGDGLNAAHITPDRMVEVLKESKLNGK